MEPTSPHQPPLPPSHARRRAAGRLATAVVLVAALGAVGLYGIGRSSGKRIAHAGACAQSLDRAAAADPLVRGDVAALTLASIPRPLDTISFDDADGRQITVASFHGKTILLNLWATWCVPCRAEMPALNRLQAALGSDRFAVVPVNIDTARLEKPRAFLKDIGATSLPFYADNTADILQSLKRSGPILGLPTTVLIGADGCEIGTMAGPAPWDSPDAEALVRQLAAPAPKQS
jgi:thiol-disulfide isomerase/thioredoxin